MTARCANLVHSAAAVVLEPAHVKELALGGAVAVTLAGVWLCWSAVGYRMSIEERVKDGKLSGEAAQRKLAQRRWLGPSVTVVGMGLLTWVVTR